MHEGFRARTVATVKSDDVSIPSTKNFTSETTFQKGVPSGVPGTRRRHTTLWRARARCSRPWFLGAHLSTNATIMTNVISIGDQAIVKGLLERYAKRCHDGGSEPRQPGATRGDVGAHCGCEDGHNGEHHFALGQFAKQVRALAALIARCVTCTIHSSVHAHVDVLACHFGARSILCSAEERHFATATALPPPPSIAPTQHVDHSRAHVPHTGAQEDLPENLQQPVSE